MPKKIHSASISLRNANLQIGDAMDVKIHNGDGKLGTLKLSSGSVVWFPKHAKQGHYMSWTAFANALDRMT